MNDNVKQSLKAIEHRLVVIEKLIMSMLDKFPEDGIATDEKLIDKWLTRDQVTKILRISYPTLRKYEREGIIKGSRMGRRVLFLRDEIESQLRKGFEE